MAHLRHAFGTHAAMFGRHPWKLMTWMGHKRIDETSSTSTAQRLISGHSRRRILNAQRAQKDPDKKVLSMLAARAKLAQRGSNVAVKPGLSEENSTVSAI